MYARTYRCYNERGSRTNYVRSSIPYCVYVCIYVDYIYTHIYMYIYIVFHVTEFKSSTKMCI
jgi:hypothetical protein